VMPVGASPSRAPRRLGRAVGRLAAGRWERGLGWLAAGSLGASAVLSLAVSPPDRPPPDGMGDLVRLMYVHVPAAWLAYLAFALVFVASVGYLVSRRTRWDRLGAASAEVGVVFTALTIVLGSIWARPTWGTWWTWDPRLTTTAVLLLIYVGYLAVRALPDNPSTRARWSAVVGIVGFADVPIVHLSVRWWRSLHQAPARLLGVPDLSTLQALTLVVAVVAFTVVYLYLLVLRLRVGRLEDRAVAEALSPRLGRPARELLEEAEAVGRPAAVPGEVGPGG
jgi:heme exporter protein C